MIKWRAKWQHVLKSWTASSNIFYSKRHEQQLGNEALTSPESASLRLQRCHLSLSSPFSLAFLIFYSSSPARLFLLSAMAASPSFFSSSPHLPEENPSPLLPSLSCVICPCVSILMAWALASSLSVSLPISFFCPPLLPRFLTIITAHFVVRIRPVL